jgi:hypothetical protein
MDTQQKEITHWYGRTAIVVFMLMGILMILTFIGSIISVFKVINGELYSDSGVWGFVAYGIMALVLLSTCFLLGESYLKRITYKGTVITQVEGLFWRRTASIDLSRVAAVSATAGRMLLFSPNNLFGLKFTDSTGKEFFAPLWSYGDKLLAALAEPLRALLLNPNVTVTVDGVGMYKALHWFYKNIPTDFDNIVVDPNRSLTSAPNAWTVTFSARHGKLIAFIVIAVILGTFFGILLIEKLAGVLS